LWRPLCPGCRPHVEHYQGTVPIFDAYGVETDISRSLERRIWLKSGGYIIIEKTEAFTAIDVNTGRYVGSYNLEETILKTNLEAVKEIAYQLRLQRHRRPDRD
jgi:ribonuclease G